MNHWITDDAGAALAIGDDTLKWAQWYETHDRHVAQDEIGPYRVSTVFLGIDHSWGMGPPVLWETMIFGLPDDEEYQERYSSRDAAVAGHKVACELARTREKSHAS